VNDFLYFYFFYNFYFCVLIIFSKIIIKIVSNKIIKELFTKLLQASFWGFFGDLLIKTQNYLNVKF
jgi:hypothetical protein